MLSIWCVYSKLCWIKISKIFPIISSKNFLNLSKAGPIIEQWLLILSFLLWIQTFYEILLFFKKIYLPYWPTVHCKDICLECRRIDEKEVFFFSYFLFYLFLYKLRGFFLLIGIFYITFCSNLYYSYELCVYLLFSYIF